MRRALAAIALGWTLCALPHAARAQEAATPAADAMSDEATQRFAQGSQLFLEHRYVEALDVLRASYRQRPSPASGLLIARCLRALGRPVEAAEMYGKVEQDARALPDPDGEYARTADAAHEEGAAVRGTLASLHVHVEHADATTRVEIDGTEIPLRDGGEALVWHVPGTARVHVAWSTGEATRDVPLLAGTDARADFAPSAAPIAAAHPAPSDGASPSRSGARAWALPAALGSGLVAAAGIGIFAGFGASSHAKFEDLSRTCGPHACGDAERAEIDAGERQQRIANIGLAIGAIGTAATVTFLVLHFTREDDAHPAARVGLSPSGVTFRGSFE